MVKKEALFLALLFTLTILLPPHLEAGPKGQEKALSHVKNPNARENILREGGKALGHVKHDDGGGDGGGGTTPTD